MLSSTIFRPSSLVLRPAAAVVRSDPRPVRTLATGGPQSRKKFLFLTISLWSFKFAKMFRVSRFSYPS